MRTLRAKSLVLAILMSVSVPLTTSGCFGGFTLSRKVYGFNATISKDKWVRWFTFLVFSILPIYLTTGLVDLIFSNTIEFWGGVSPFAAGEPRTRYAWGPDGELIASELVSPDVVEVRFTDRDGVLRRLRIERERESLAAYDEGGKLLARVGDAGGGPALLDWRR